jgi:hypothetical protein
VATTDSPTRFQHVFEKNLSQEDSKKAVKVGSIRGKADDLFRTDDSAAPRKNGPDPSLSGISSVLNMVKDKFEAKDSEPVAISHGVTIKKKSIPAAETFTMMELKLQKEAADLQRQNSSSGGDDWAWKKKDPKQLAVETTIAMYGAGKEAPKKSEREKKRAEQQQQGPIL